MRMGIFTKRRVKKDEELTFNYNVDRYGCVWQLFIVVSLNKHSYSHDAQPCYCGEAKCVGFIGGKTQTDIATMDDVVLDGEFCSSSLTGEKLIKFIMNAALGMTEDVELLNLKGTKRKKGKKLDEDFAVWH